MHENAINTIGILQILLDCLGKESLYQKRIEEIIFFNGYSLECTFTCLLNEKHKEMQFTHVYLISLDAYDKKYMNLESTFKGQTHTKHSDMKLKVEFCFKSFIAVLNMDIHNKMVAITYKSGPEY